MTDAIKFSHIVFCDIEANGLAEGCLPSSRFLRAADITGWSTLNSDLPD